MNPIEIFSNSQDLLGESPRWHPLENCLYWVDIEAGVIHRQAPGNVKTDSHSIGLKVGCLAFTQPGGLILATSHGFQHWNRESNTLTPISDPEPGKANARFNDGLVDAGGRFWAGTMTETDTSSSLYRLNPDYSVHTMLTGVTISNGIGWNKENTRLYYTDTLTRTIWVYDFELSSGLITNRRVFIKMEGPGVPDGLAVDSEGNVWSVNCGTGTIHVLNSSGDKIDEFQFPTRCITACTFGGTDMSVLFVTSSRSLLDASELSGDPLAGNVFSLMTNSHGMPQHFFG